MRATLVPGAALICSFPPAIAVAAGRYHSLIVERDNMPGVLEVSAESPDGLVMAVRHKTLKIEGVQFHPESILTEHGKKILQNFLEL